MLLKPSAGDWRVIAHFAGRLTIGVGLFMFVPLFIGVLSAEWAACIDFIIAIAITLTAGIVMSTVFPDTADLTTAQGLIIVAMAWILAMVFGSIPLYLSGHYLHVLDALFDSMSALTTTGLVLIQDLDHASNTLNTWRHLMTFIGGQGIAVVALTILVRLTGAGGAFEMYAGEAREERIVPNVARTARFIWLVTTTYLILGTSTLFVVFSLSGVGGADALLHGLWVFMGSFDTAGHAPQSQSILFYHSASVEAVTAVLMILGSLSFGLHYTLWRGTRSEIWRNIEPKVLFISMCVLAFGTLLGLTVLGTFAGTEEFLRKGVYQLISAHTSTGYMNVYPAQIPREWGGLALLSLVIAMGLGGMTSSTAGGVKALRVAVTIQAFIFEVRRIISPESAVLVQKYHHFKERILTDRLTRNSLLIFSAYMFVFFAGGALGMAFGYPFEVALFESTSAASNNGISAGLASADMPWPLKVAYMTEMWFGRLEFLAVWAFVGYAYAAWRGR